MREHPGTGRLIGVDVSDRICAVSGCGPAKRIRAHGMCGKHAQRFRKYGTTDPPPGVFASTEERFWAKVDRRGANECWPWTAGVDSDGYGSFRPGGSAPCVTASRFSWVLAHPGVLITPDINVCHHCDNPPCCNPDHLFVGTVAANMADRNRKGRQARGQRVIVNRDSSYLRGDSHWKRRQPARTPRGEAIGTARFTEADVRAMREAYALGELQTSIAKRYGTAQAVVSGIIRRKSWAHVD